MGGTTKSGRGKAATPIKTAKASALRVPKTSTSRSASRPAHHGDVTRIYLSEIGRTALLTADEEKHFARLALSGDEAARQRMIESNLRLVVKIARRYVNRGLALLDLIEEAADGLLADIRQQHGF